MSPRDGHHYQLEIRKAPCRLEPPRTRLLLASRGIVPGVHGRTACSVVQCSEQWLAFCSMLRTRCPGSWDPPTGLQKYHLGEQIYDRVVLYDYVAITVPPPPRSYKQNFTPPHWSILTYLSR